MLTKISSVSAAVAACALFLLPTYAADPNGPPEVIPAVQHDVSPPLRGMSAAAPGAERVRERPLRPVPQNVIETNAPDPVVQAAPGAPNSSFTLGNNFAGVGQGDYGYSVQWAPPDTTGAVGATQYVQWVNDNLAVFDKSTGVIVRRFSQTR